MGGIDRDDAQGRAIAKDVGVIVVSVEYRLAPASPYPAGLDDCVSAYRWALKNTKLLNTTANQVITCGGSAGGNLALSTALKIIDQVLGDTLEDVVAIVPVTIAPEAVPEKYKRRAIHRMKNMLSIPSTQRRR
jgi:versiconal hemiacetal acetate esterase